ARGLRAQAARGVRGLDPGHGGGGAHGSGADPLKGGGRAWNPLRLPGGGGRRGAGRRGRGPPPVRTDHFRGHRRERRRCGASPAAHAGRRGRRRVRSRPPCRRARPRRARKRDPRSRRRHPVVARGRAAPGRRVHPHAEHQGRGQGSAMISFKRLYALMRKEWIQVMRDSLTLRFIIAVPTMQLFLFGYAINTNPQHLPTGLLAVENSKYERTIIAALHNTGYYDIRTLASEAEAERALAQGELMFVIAFPPNFD